MLPGAHGGEIAGVHELQAAVHGAEAGQHHKLPRRRPEDVVGRLPLVLLQQDWGLAGLEHSRIERNCSVLRLQTMLFRIRAMLLLFRTDPDSVFDFIRI